MHRSSFGKAGANRRSEREKGTMIQIRKAAVTLDEQEMIELEQIIADRRGKEALRFLRHSVYNKLIHTQRGRLQPDLNQGQ